MQVPDGLDYQVLITVGAEQVVVAVLQPLPQLSQVVVMYLPWLGEGPNLGPTRQPQVTSSLVAE
ncbi:hypothetical protein ADL01_05725 [Streptomyces sp. NRRL WC-3618]|uniref:hypothetical protein n=1 Tax=Streptomyces sp. NRRL WC-3618 TaxID=1519490 RepID=UPI0006B06A31|nr:hypothetical protein [Streptomyces sp. NRRL WC-3618]KOV86900.1 hypothetical protein ADL01_05725 [Streptomyces sp. NRRL WC-3618]